MNLDVYLKRPEAMSLSRLADLIGVSKGRLSQLRNSTDWPPELALAVEEKTDGDVSASVLSPTVAKARQTGAAA